MISQYQNIGAVRNEGWELQGSVNTGPITTKGTYSWTKSRVLGVSPAFRASYPASAYPSFQPGSTFSFFPEHTWAIMTSYAAGRTSLSVNMNGIGPFKGPHTMGLYDIFLSRLDADKPRMSFGGTIPTVSAYMTADINGVIHLSSAADVVMQIQNVGNIYRNDYTVLSATMGRQTKLGARLRF
jgi:outer membrane receptor protein involved in Fe transport